MRNRVLVRLNEIVPTSPAQMNTELGQGLTWKPYRSPGVADTIQLLEGLEQEGFARRTDEGWLLTDAGVRRRQLLEDRFDNSNGYGDYGF